MLVSEVFYSLQGEGRHQGRAAAFVRFFGCDLACDFCDEPLHKTQKFRRSKESVLDEISQWQTRFVVLTGGEPSLGDRGSFIRLLHKQGYEVAVETNGYCPENIKSADWVTYSPKDWLNVNYEPFYDEVKLICDLESDPKQILMIADQSSKQVLLQPKAVDSTKASLANADFCRRLVLEYPQLRLSLGIHRFLNFK